MKIKHNLYPGGKYKALTLSYDDGTIHDRRMVEIMNRYHIKGSFHLNSGVLGHPNNVKASEVKALYDGHEVSAHSVTHPFLEQIPRERVIMEMIDDRKALEQLVGYPVRGMSYPFGTFNQQVVDLLSALGFQYARTVLSTQEFRLPESPLLWKPTCHHKEMLQLGEQYLKLGTEPKRNNLSLFYVWGHSYEFENDSNWEEFETFCRMMSNADDIWFATNIEIIDYLDAVRRLNYSLDGTLVSNPSAISVWIEVNQTPVEIKAGELKSLQS
ncbi:polysaccharide deacetylase [Paenibacillus baekrokdamisoli]|uniref:Polysaccharide deacetylase n=1 Tax=Paenibacillus baekrokdamisoli TaxID=1712516 RepID=A0A3G9J5X2_9BACL|nr:polysaccharide deacetylase family protein [Paenibacillus baekrokdamisoli]MBB3069274.1 hypothetical protein [Paenibacillus baekrokdamisoli]BBH18754.1 polysaccharide deacetylase [Paenibacillus baekrokdamisoli]